MCAPWHRCDGKTHHVALLLNYLIPSGPEKLLINLIALRAFLLSPLNCFVAASSPLLLVPVPSCHLSSSSPSLESSLHQSSFCPAKQSPCSSTARSSLSPSPRLPVPGWAGLRALPRGLGFSEFRFAARYSCEWSNNGIARARWILNNAAWVLITHANRSSPSLLQFWTHGGRHCFSP